MNSGSRQRSPHYSTFGDRLRLRLVAILGPLSNCNELTSKYTAFGTLKRPEAGLLRPPKGRPGLGVGKTIVERNQHKTWFVWVAVKDFGWLKVIGLQVLVLSVSPTCCVC